MKRLTAIFLALGILFSFASCIKDESPVALTLEDKTITQNVYLYWVSTYKATFMSTYSDVEDTDEFWDSVIFDGVTAEKYLSDLTLEYVKNTLVTTYLFDEFGLKISDEDIETAESIVFDLCDYTAEGNKNAFNAMLAQYGVNYDMLKQVYLDEYKATYVYNHVFGNGVLVVGDSQKQEFLEENYSRVRHIYINNEYDREKSYYDDDGNFIMEPLSEEKQKEQDAKVEAVKAALAAGEDFDSVYEKYSEEKDYKNGYYLSIDTTGLPDELITNALACKVGETKEFDSTYGYHAIYGMEMDKAPWANEDNADFFEDFADSVYGSVFASYLAGYFEKITVDQAVVDEVSIRTALPNYSFQY